MTAPALVLAETQTGAPILAPVPSKADCPVEQSIIRFLHGESDGRELFKAMYGDALGEPVPAEMLALIRGACPA